MSKAFRLAICLIVFAQPIYCIAQDASPGGPLTVEELRDTLGNLLQGLADGDKAKTLQEFLDRERALSDREKAAAAAQLDAEHQSRVIAEKERDIEKKRGDELDLLLKAANKHRGFGCVLKKVFTLGLARC